MITGTKANHHGQNVVGYRRATYSYTKRSKNVNKSKPQKTGHNMDCSLKLDYMNKELLVIVYHHGTVKIIFQLGTNYSSSTERCMRNKFGCLLIFIVDKNTQFCKILEGCFRMRDTN